jgi:hypothetical protein
MKKLLIILLSMISLATVAVAPASVMAQASKDAVCQGIGLTGSNDKCIEEGPATVNSTVKNAINLISVVVGIAAIIMIIIGGFKYITSAGDSSKVNSAKDTVLFAIVGLVIVMLAQVIVRFVISRATG